MLEFKRGGKTTAMEPLRLLFTDVAADISLSSRGTLQSVRRFLSIGTGVGAEQLLLVCQGSPPCLLRVSIRKTRLLMHKTLHQNSDKYSGSPLGSFPRLFSFRWFVARINRYYRKYKLWIHYFFPCLNQREARKRIRDIVWEWWRNPLRLELSGVWYRLGKCS